MGDESLYYEPGAKRCIMAILTFLKGLNQGATVPLEGERIVLGRQETCTIVLNVPAVSREHAIIRRVQGKYFIEDLKSRNGTFVNNQEVTGAVQLKDNDRIKICDTLIAFQESKKPALPDDIRKGAGSETEEDEGSSTVEATVSHSSRNILETQPSEKLAFLLNLTTELTARSSTAASRPAKPFSARTPPPTNAST
jgi:sigma-B regulation protein RsbU (phosphoserine phosphatase)